MRNPDRKYQDDARGTVAVASPPTWNELQAAPAPTPTDTADAVVSPSVYTRLLADALPRLLHVIDPAPWRDGAAATPSGTPHSARLSFRRQSATLALGMLLELDARRADSEYLTEVIRSSLIRWQLSLGNDGRPLRRRDLASPFHGATLECIIQLLSETTGFQTTLLLADVGRQLNWVAKGPAATPWLEAATIAAMSDGAVLVRDLSLLARARGRLARLLATQNAEGWFPENAGADIGRLSLTVDALARVYHHTGWEELHRSLGRALAFLTHFVHPDGSVGGCYGARMSAFMSPHGIELLAPTFPDAAAMALSWRNRCRDCPAEVLLGCDDDRPAVLGAGVAMAAAYASRRVREAPELPCERTGRRRFPNAGLTVASTASYYAVVNGRKGGSMHVTWRSGRPPVYDAGVTVVYPRRLRTSARMDDRTYEEVAESMITVSGVLRRADSVAVCARGRCGRLVRRLLRWCRRPFGEAGRRQGTGRGQHLSHDRFRREVTFGDNWVRIHDDVQCRLPCRAVICQSPPPRRDDWLGPTDVVAPWPRAPIFVAGGRRVEFSRLYRDGELCSDP